MAKPPRAFTLVDAMTLVAATAVGLAGTQPSWKFWGYGWFWNLDRGWTADAILRRLPTLLALGLPVPDEVQADATGRQSQQQAAREPHAVGSQAAERRVFRVPSTTAAESCDCKFSATESTAIFTGALGMIDARRTTAWFFGSNRFADKLPLIQVPSGAVSNSLLAWIVPFVSVAFGIHRFNKPRVLFNLLKFVETDGVR